MKLGHIQGAQVSGLKGSLISIEVDIFRGFHTFSIVGLPDTAVEESKDRVNSAIKSAGFVSPKTKGQQKVVVSLAPADIKKEGPLFDLPIALGYLIASEQISFDPKEKLFIGELSLGGELRKTKGILVMTQVAQKAGCKEIYVPRENAREAALIEGIRVFGVSSLKELITHLNEKVETQIFLEPTPQTPYEINATNTNAVVDFEDVAGQESAKRGLQIAAAGRHNIAFFGPPGTGKTLLARSLVSIMPPLSFLEALEVTGIHSSVGSLDTDLITNPPFRSPHHTSSYVSVIGGGAHIRPGEATLAHRGVLFLDEFPEFDRRVIESLREPIEEGSISIARARGSEVFPSSFILVAAMNPCPCGYFKDETKHCVCSPGNLQKYQRKISGPIIDRIDMWIEVPRIAHEKLSKTKRNEERLQKIKDTIVAAHKKQRERFAGTRLTHNAHMSVKDLKTFAPLKSGEETLLNTAAKKLDLSARAYHRIIKLARTIADLEGSDSIASPHILEAIQYRPKNFF